VSYHGIYRVNNNQLVEQVVADSVGELAFDREGNLYVGNWGNYDPIYWGHVIQYDAAYRFAGRVANVPYLNGLLFARDERGEMTSRLLTIQDAFIHHLITLADRAALAPGSGVGVRLHRADFITLRAGIVGSAYLDTLRTTSTSDSVSWSVAAGALPPGVHLSSAGVLSGTPITNGTFLFAARGLHGAEVWYGHATLSIQPVSISLNQIVDALLGGPPLSAALVGWLDGQCNHNGQLDIGDLRCYARLNAALPSSH
jgi:hypothetical protein